jgi:hypothetical protein
LTRRPFPNPLELEERLASRIPEPAPEPDVDEAAAEEIRADALRFLGLRPNAPLEVIQAGFANDLWAFWQFFFPHYRQAPDGSEIPSAPYQTKLCADLEALVIDGRGGEQLARAYPREHAKSVFATLVMPLWAILSGHRKFAYLFSDTETQAVSFLEDTRIEVETNERLAAVYPEAVEWEGLPRFNRLVFKTGAVMAAAGSGKSVRGARKRSQRPDLIVLDDIENDQEVINPERRRKKKTWYNKVVKKLGASAVVAIVGTILHAESFLAQQIEHDEHIHSAVVRDADRQDLWREWESVLRDRTLPDREAAARAFYDANRAEMDAGAERLWPGNPRFALYQFYLERAEDLAAYLSERQNKPFDPTASYFPEERLRFVPADEMPPLTDSIFNAGFWDPSRGTATGDTSSAGREDTFVDGTRIITEAVADRIPPEQVMDVIIAWHKKRPFNVFGVEKVGLSSYDEQLRGRALAAGVNLPVVAVTPVGPKQLRIKSLRPGIVAQTLQFADTLPLEAKRQLSFYPQHPHDDFPDMVQQADKLTDEHLADVEAASGTREPETAARIEGSSFFDRPAGLITGLGERLGKIGRAFS